VEKTKLLIHNLVNDIQDPLPRSDEGI